MRGVPPAAWCTMQSASTLMRSGSPTGNFQSVPYVFLRLAGVQGADVVVADDALRELPQLRAAQCRPQLRLAHEDHLQLQHLPSGIEIRQHPQLFELVRGQVLRLVDDQQQSAPGLIFSARLPA